MKKTLYPFLAVGMLAACQQHKPVTAETAPVAVAAVPQSRADEKALPVLFSTADTLTKPMRQLLNEYDLSKLWQGDMKERRQDPTLQGFFGPDHYRFALVFNDVVRDKQHPEIYHVQGRCRYRKNIRPFEGKLTVRQIADLDAPWDYDEL